jgi:cyclic pyranopterin phosphate synthase
LPTATWAALRPLDRYALAKVVSRGRPERTARAYDEIVGASALTPHLGPDGAARMVDVGEKPVTQRRATARSRVVMNREAWARLESSTAPKGDVLATARLAGIMAAKRTHELVPLCHPLHLTRIDVALDLDSTNSAVAIEASVEARDRTGVEMEALVAASVAALTVYDMLKAFDRSMTIGPTELVAKSGGRSGDFRR